jgi:hypothetical protein
MMAATEDGRWRVNGRWRVEVEEWEMEDEEGQ